MKTKITGMMLGLLAFAGAASAEMISGTITSIDPGANKITLLRSDTRDSITVAVKDQQALDALQAGSNVTLDANKRLFGGWEAQSVNGSAAMDQSSAMDAQSPSPDAPSDAVESPTAVDNANPDAATAPPGPGI